ncbi:MAG TPA: DUF4129 domain-containing protein, partial [Firmicutes bacterium]|nr:DUF4129 domain-containing protein [Bacillota bacterium]
TGIIVFFSTILATILAGLQIKHFILYFCVFFLLSLAATFISRQKEQQSGTNVLVPVTVFPGIILSLSLPPLFLFLKPLAAVTESGKELFKGLVTPVARFLFFIAGFIVKLATKLGKLNEIADTGSDPGLPPPDMAPGDVTGSLPPWLQQALAIILNIVIAITIIAAALVSLFYLYRYLTTKKYEGEKVNFWEQFFAWLNFLYSRVLSMLTWLARALKRNRVKASIKIYKRFLRIGGWSGFARLATETPSEYSERLAKLLPMHSNDIELICESLNCEIFAGSEPDAKHMEQLKKAARNLCCLKNRFYCLSLKWFRTKEKEVF